MDVQKTVNNLASLVTRYEDTDRWNESPGCPFPKVTIVRKDEIDAIRNAIGLIMGDEKR